MLSVGLMRFQTGLAAADVETDSQPLLLFKPSFNHDKRKQFTANFSNCLSKETCQNLWI